MFQYREWSTAVYQQEGEVTNSHQKQVGISYFQLCKFFQEQKQQKAK